MNPPEDHSSPDEHLSPEQLFVKTYIEAIQDHPGTPLRWRIEEFQRVLTAWAGFSLALREFIDECENDPDIHGELIRNVGDRSKQSQLILQLDQRLIAYVAGAGALIDHSRNLARDQPSGIEEAHKSRAAAMLADVPASAFFGKLRNYILHKVVAPWAFQMRPNGNITEGIVSLQADRLLESKSTWTKDARAFLLGCEGRVRLSDHLREYEDANMMLCATLITDIMNARSEEFEELTTLQKELRQGMTGGRFNNDALRHHDLEERLRVHRENEPE